MLRNGRFCVSVAVLATVLAIPMSAQATGARVTQGDARAILEAFPNGGWAVRLSGATLEGAPADFQRDSLARISPMATWNGRHFCALDWHVINVAAIEGNALGESRTNKEILDHLAQIEIDLALDGSPLETTRSAIARTTNPEFRGYVEAFFVQEGRLMAPHDLSIGQHSVQFTGHRPGQPPEVFAPVTFFVDAPGAGVCA